MTDGFGHAHTVTIAAEERPAPRLIARHVPRDPAGVVLVLHGGAGRGAMPVTPTQPSVLRMIPIASRMARDDSRLAVYRLLNATRGLGATPLANVRWALDEVERRHGGLRVALIGHSLGGSVALAAGGSKPVDCVVALAPWLGGAESARPLTSCSSLIVHGDQDRITSCGASQAYSTRARELGARSSFIRVQRGEHTMLRRLRTFDTLATRYVRHCFDPATPDRRRSLVEAMAVDACDQPGDYSI